MTWVREQLRARRDTAEDGGFTLVELVIAIGLIAFVFAAVAGVLTSGLKALAVQKTRTQGNEIATQAIEDLQRRSFDYLVVCKAPTGTVPAGIDLNDLVTGAGCPGTSDPGYATYGEDPCNNLNPNDAPSSDYSCKRLNTTYQVRRYILWTDEGHTTKRLAVYVDWTDTVGKHQVSQQSSLRTPTAAAIIGLAPPVLTANSSSVSIHDGTNGSNPIDANGALTEDVTFTVTGQNLKSTDRVYASFVNLDAGGNSFTETVLLSGSGTGTTLWTKTIKTGYKFGAGSQFVTFTAIRLSDGKGTGAISSAVKFCPTTDPGCASLTLPQITSATVSSSTIALDATGALKNDFTVEAVTQNMTATDDMQVFLPTLSGVQAVSLTAKTGCTISNCQWSATIPKGAGYAFATGSRTLSFTGSQDVVAGTVDQGNTASRSSSPVSFGA